MKAKRAYLKEERIMEKIHINLEAIPTTSTLKAD